MIIQDYIDYFKELSVDHSSIAHAVTAGDVAYRLIDIEEAFGDFVGKAKPKGIIVRIIIPQVVHKDNQLTISGGFIIAKHINSSASTESDYIGTLSETGQITTDFFEKMKDDSMNGHELFAGSFDSNHEFSRQNISLLNYHGWRSVFSFTREAPCPDLNVFS